MVILWKFQNGSNDILNLVPLNYPASIGEYVLFEFCSASPKQLAEACFKTINTTGEVI